MKLIAGAVLAVAAVSAFPAVAQFRSAESSPVTTPDPRPDTIVLPKDLDFRPFSLPGFCGDLKAAFVNTDLDKAPFIALLRMAPGAVLARHFHTRQIEAVYVVDGIMINDGAPLPAGSTLLHAPGVVHGPHTTETGTTLVFIQYGGVGPEDSVFVDDAGNVTPVAPACGMPN
jgi:hypothetical protein